ncbi:MAG: RidA family protein [Rhodospirillales bacterium]|nr:RidA family protein [Rhodospirillales bacterium]
MARRLISSGSSFEELAGYSRAVIDGDWVFVSGTTGFDYAAGTIVETVEEQTVQALRNIETALNQAGAALADVVRVRIYLTDRDDFAALAPVIGAAFRDIRPANTTVVSGLVDERMKVEIEVTARLSQPREGNA